MKAMFFSVLALLIGLSTAQATTCKVGKSVREGVNEKSFEAFSKKNADLIKEGGLENIFTAIAYVQLEAGAMDIDGSTLTIDRSEITFHLVSPDMDKMPDIGMQGLADALKDYKSFQKLSQTIKKLPKTKKSEKYSCSILAAGVGKASYICQDGDEQLLVAFARDTKKGTVKITFTDRKTGEATVLVENKISCK